MNKRNVAFEGWRVIFILFMVLHHFDGFSDLDIPSFTGNIKKFCYEGFVGVNFFFMLSGLGCVIGYKNKLENHEITAGSFLYNRLAKLYPTYFLFLLSAVFLYYNGHFGNFIQFLMHMLMLQAYPITSNMAFGYNGVAWCISTTMFFYLIFIAIHKIDFKDCLKYISFLLIFIGINMLYHDENGSVMIALFYTNPLFRLVDFLTGMAIALYFRNHRPVCSWKMQVASILIFVVFLIGGAYGNISWLYKWDVYYLFPCAFLLFSFYGETRLSKAIFDHKFWLPLSSSSMIIFLSHQEILQFVKKHIPQNLANDFYNHFMPWGILACLLLIIVVSLIINVIYTQPMSALIKNAKIYKKQNVSD